jgi:cytochrome P450
MEAAELTEPRVPDPARTVSFLTAELQYDPFAELGVEDPYPLYARLRDEAPAYHNPDRDFWALSRFEDVQAAARDWETFSSEPCVDPDYVGVRLRLNSFLDLDPPMHDLLRRIVKAHFTPKAIKELEATTGAVAEELVGTFVAAGEADLAPDFAWGLPLKVTMTLLGLPREDFPFLRDTFELLWQDNRLWIEPAQDAPSRVAAARIHEYFAARLLERERHPTGDVLSTIARARAPELEIDVLAELSIVLYIAGYETTANLLSNSVLHLAEHPEQRAWLAANPDRLQDAVEELLRFDAPVQVLARNTTKPVELHGRGLPAGARVLLLYGAANRDPRRYDDPDRLDLGRPVLRHLSFGNGIHHCLGAPLARQEARVALATLLARVPDYMISGPVVRNTNMVSTRGIVSLPASVSANAEL